MRALTESPLVTCLSQLRLGPLPHPYVVSVPLSPWSFYFSLPGTLVVGSEVLPSLPSHGAISSLLTNQRYLGSSLYTTLI